MKKNLFLMAMAIMALGFTACTSDNDDNPMPEVVTDDKPLLPLCPWQVVRQQ